MLAIVSEHLILSVTVEEFSFLIFFFFFFNQFEQSRIWAQEKFLVSSKLWLVTTQERWLKTVVRSFSESSYTFFCEPHLVGSFSREHQVLVKNKLLLAGQNLIVSLAANISVDFCPVHM